jgi:hypothetical protein
MIYKIETLNCKTGKATFKNIFTGNKININDLFEYTPKVDSEAYLIDLFFARIVISHQR